MKRLALLSLLFFGTAYADVSIKVAINFDNTVDTNYRDGTKPQGGGGCSTWTCISKGDADGDVTEVSTTALTIAASGTTDEPANTTVPGGIDIAYKNTATDNDLQIEGRIPASWTGHTENFTGFGVGFSAEDGTAANDYTAHVWWPFVGTARIKTDAGGVGEAETAGAVGQFLPRYLAITYDDSATSICGYESDDATTWSLIGACVTKSLTFPVISYVFGTSHDAAQTTTAALTAVAFTTTIDITDGGAPDPPTGSDFPISSGTATFDCNANSVEPGDTITLAAGNRGNLSFTNCFGDSSNDITIRNDTTGGGPTIILGTATWILNCTNCEHVTFDGTGKWSGAGATDCSNLTTALCGIVVRCSANNPQSYLRLRGSSKNVTVKGVEIDGLAPSCDTSAPGIGIAVQDHNYKLVDHPGEWREGFTIHNNYIHDVASECMYIGPNQSGGGAGDLQLRNNHIYDMRIEDCGWDGIEMKSAIGTPRSSIHHNFVKTTGVNTGNASVGNLGIGISLYESGNVDVYNNWVEDAGLGATTGPGHCFWLLLDQLDATEDVASVTAKYWNNVAVDCKSRGYQIGRKLSTNSALVVDVYNNTTVSAGGGAIRINPMPSTTGFIQDNIFCDSGAVQPHNHVTSNNNTAACSTQDFDNLAGEDYHLGVNSPTRNAGSTYSSPPSDDYDDASRPRESINDVGAYEHIP